MCLGLLSSDNRIASYRMEEKQSKYVPRNYKVFFSNKLASKHEPIVYSGACISGDPEAVYYRIVNKDKQEFCIHGTSIIGSISIVCHRTDMIMNLYLYI